MNIKEEAINPYFDFSDSHTLEVVCSLNEAEQSSALNVICDKLYDKIIDEKFEKIDFGEIDKSKGVITEYSGYDDMMDSLSIISSLIAEFKGDNTSVNCIYKAIQNIEENSSRFKKAFVMDVELPMVAYSSLTLAVIQSTSLLIATCVELIKTPGTDNFQMELDKLSMSRSRDALLFRTLQKFNKSCEKGDFQKAMDYIIDSNIKNKKNLVGSSAAMAVLATSSAIAVLMSIIPLLRELIYIFYHTRTRISDYLEIQADLLDSNAYSLEMKQTNDPEQAKKIAEKQHKIATKFAKLANFIAIQNKAGENKAEQEIKKDSKIKFKADEIVETMPEKMAKSDETLSASLF